jgi:hypothetical protein
MVAEGWAPPFSGSHGFDTGAEALALAAQDCLYELKTLLIGRGKGET